jgi:hypothetical protein
MKMFFDSKLLPVTILVLALGMLLKTLAAPPGRTIATAHPIAPADRFSFDTLPLETRPVAAAANGLPKTVSQPVPETPVAEFAQLKEKALRTAGEQMEFERLIRARPVLREALLKLGGDPSAQGRADALALIDEALSDEYNPEAAFVVEEVERLIFADNLTQDLPAAARRLLAADKGELMLSYLGAYPGRLERLIQFTQGTSNQNLVSNVLKVAERRRQQSMVIVQEMNALSK